ncbi:hypothetical protein BRC62_00225 [Halobacteriales archaeon QH_10_67_13]|nr:MAG: hypothetical protein BRC62_00225 [Halobacteriales archaeon QH_10_67_13]
MFDAPRNDQELALFQDRIRLASELDSEFARPYQEQFVGILVMVPDELSLNFGEFDRLPVELRVTPTSPHRRVAIGTGRCLSV